MYSLSENMNQGKKLDISHGGIQEQAVSTNFREGTKFANIMEHEKKMLMPMPCPDPTKEERP